MRRLTSFLSLLILPFALSAQISGSGFYRVQNYTTERYITVIENLGSIVIRTNSADMRAIQTLSGFERVNVIPLLLYILIVKEKSLGMITLIIWLHKARVCMIS